MVLHACPVLSHLFQLQPQIKIGSVLMLFSHGSSTVGDPKNVKKDTKGDQKEKRTGSKHFHKEEKEEGVVVVVVVVVVAAAAAVVVVVGSSK